MPRPNERTHLPSPLAQREGSGGPNCRGRRAAARGESGGEPSVASARHRCPAPASPSANPVGSTESELNPRCDYLLPASWLLAAALTIGIAHGRGEAAAPRAPRPEARRRPTSPSTSPATTCSPATASSSAAGSRPRRRAPGQGRLPRPAPAASCGRPPSANGAFALRWAPAQHRHLRGPRLRRPRPRASAARRAPCAG